MRSRHVARDTLQVSRRILDWAAHQTGESLQSVAESIAKRPRDRERILSGDLTPGQVEKIAKRAGVPFGFLFLSEPPMLPRPQIPDLRQRPDALPLSADFFDVLEDVLNKRQWFIEHLGDNADRERVAFVASFKYANHPPAELVARDIRIRLQLTEADRQGSGSTDEYFSLLSERAEALGILVMKSGIVRSNTRRPLSTDEFQGFAIADPVVPIVFVNGRDFVVSTVFTLAHELAHIWLGESGVTDTPRASARGVERLCNQIAAEVLTPKAEFLRYWRGPASVTAIATHFRVSRWVVAIKALELQLIDQATCDAILEVRFSRRTREGGHGLRTIPVRNSKRLTRELVASAMSGRTLIRHAAALLSVRPDTVIALAHYEPP